MECGDGSIVGVSSPIMMDCSWQFQKARASPRAGASRPLASTGRSPRRRPRRGTRNSPSAESTRTSPAATASTPTLPCSPSGGWILLIRMRPCCLASVFGIQPCATACTTACRWPLTFTGARALADMQPAILVATCLCIRAQASVRPLPERSPRVYRMLQIGAEPNEECVRIWEALECSMCHPTIGTQPGPPAICTTFCDRLYDSCQSAFFATDPVANVGASGPCIRHTAEPCSQAAGEKAHLCLRLSCAVYPRCIGGSMSFFEEVLYSRLLTQVWDCALFFVSVMHQADGLPSWVSLPGTGFHALQPP